jgi:hypothetical protein
MANQRATVTHPNMACPPVVSEGEITPEVICEFEYHAKVFFLNVKGELEDSLKVSRILGCFHDSLVCDWVTCEEATLKVLSFPDFLTALRNRWLDSDWEHTLVSQILGSRLNPTKEKFETWALHIQKLNVTLQGTTSHLGDAQLHSQLEAALDEDLRILATEEKANKTEGLLPWIEKVCNIDRKRQTDRKRRREEIEQVLCNQKRLFNPTHTQNAPSLSTATETTSENPYPPHLTQEERRLLQDNDGCFKCRCFFAGHRSDTCTTVLTGKGYKPLTARDAVRAKAAKQNTHTHTVAAVTSTSQTVEDEPSRDLIAAVFPNARPPSNDKDNEDMLNDSLVSVSGPPPLTCEHFLWKCSLIDSPVLTPITALIDSGAHTVLIRLSLVKRLGLQPTPLPTPLRVNVAIANSPRALTHFVTIKPASLDRMFRSKPLHAVVTDDLTMPLILGLPFLVTNRITCNYADRECNVPFGNDVLNLLARPKSTLKIKKTDILAAILQKVRTPAPEHTLLENETELRERFHSVFETLPHVDELPRDPVAQI